MEGEIFDWLSLLNEKKIEAAGVMCMKHAPGVKNWIEYVNIGMKVVVKHQNVPPNKYRRKFGFWVATIVQTRGYYCLLRYEGMEQNANFDFWIHIGNNDVYSVADEVKKMVLIPPACLTDKVSDWRTHFIENLSETPTIPPKFSHILRQSITGCKYRIGDHLEVIDKYKISQLRVARVSKIVGRRMYLKYLDETNDGFFCHEQSSLIHSLGWANCVGHKLKAPPDFDVSDAKTADVPMVKNKIKENTLGTMIKEGMKLEAVDPLCPSRICAATVCQVLEFDYMMIKMDCYESKPPVDGSDEALSSSDNDWFCYHLKSPYIFQCGFCQVNGVPLIPPFGENEKEFCWKDYLNANDCLAASIPEKETINHDFSIGMKLEMVDIMQPNKIHVATVIQIAGRLLRINFDGWESLFDQWVDVESPDIFPMGWCALVGHQLNGPINMSKNKQV